MQLHLPHLLAAYGLVITLGAFRLSHAHQPTAERDTIFSALSSPTIAPSTAHPSSAPSFNPSLSPTNTPTAGTTGTCSDSSWTKSGSYCYKYYLYWATWDVANATCSSDGGWLATIANSTENSNVLDLTYYLGSWIGLRAYSNENYSWQGGPLKNVVVYKSSGTVAGKYTNWDSGYPTGSDCGLISSAWQDYTCSGYSFFLCQFSLTYPTSSPSSSPSAQPTARPSTHPSFQPSRNPTLSPSSSPSVGPTTISPSLSPSTKPTSRPSTHPSFQPSTIVPSVSLSVTPTPSPSGSPSVGPTSTAPTLSSSENPTSYPSALASSFQPLTYSPSSNVSPTYKPSAVGNSSQPTVHPSLRQTVQPTTSLASTSNGIALSCNPCGLRENGTEAVVSLGLLFSPVSVVSVTLSVHNIDSGSHVTLLLSQSALYFSEDNYTQGADIIISSHLTNDTSSHVYNLTATVEGSRFTSTVQIYKFIVPPKPFANASLSEGLNGFNVVFDGPTNELGKKTSFSCESVFVNSSRLGAGSSCLFTTSTQLLVVFGTNAVSIPGDILIIKNQVLLAPTSPLTRTSEAPSDAFVSGSITIIPPDTFATPSVVIIGPTTVSNCTNVTFDASQSINSGGREFTYIWRITPSIDDKFVRNTNKSALVILQGGFSPTTYTISLALTNYIGRSSSASVQLTVSNDSVVEVYINGPNTISMYTWQQVSVYASVTTPSCLAGGSTLDIDWAVSSSTSTAVTSAVITESNIARRLVVSKYALPAGSVTVFTVTSQIHGRPSSLSSAQVTVTIVSSHLVLTIEGGSKRQFIISSTNTIHVKAFDPDGCLLNTTVTCSSALECFYRLDGTTLVLQKDSLQEGTYTFIFNTTCSVDSRYTVAAVEVDMRSSSVSGASVHVYSPSSYEIYDSFNPTNRLVLKAELSNSSAASYWYQWTSEQVDTATYSTGTNGLYLAIIPDSLAGPKTYWFTCTVYADGLPPASASVSVYANQIPASGSYQVTPSVGTAFITVFDMQLLNWVDSDLPLAFSFAAAIDGKEIPLAASNPRNQLQTFLWEPSSDENVTMLGYVYDSYGAMAWADTNVTVISDGSVSSLSLLRDTQDALTYEKFGEKALRLLLAESSNVSNHTELQTMLNLVSNCSAYVDNDVDNLHQQIIVLGEISDGSASHAFLYQATTVLSTIVVRYNGSDTASTAFAIDVVQLVSVISGSDLFTSSESSSEMVQEAADIISDRAASYLLVPGEAAEVYGSSNFQLYTAVFDSEESVEVLSPWATAVVPSVAFTGPLSNSGLCGNVQVTSTAWVAAANPFSWSDKVDVYAAVIGVELKDCSHTAQSISNLTSPLTFSVIANASTTRNITLGILESSVQTCVTKLDILTFNCSDQLHNVSCASYWPDAVNFTCPFTQTSCVYWDVQTQSLSNSGCYAVEVVAENGTTNTTCACNHLTVFTSTAGSYSEQVKSTAGEDPNKSDLKRNYAVVICIATLYGALVACLVVGNRYDQMQDEMRLKTLLHQKPKSLRSLKSPPSVLSMLKSGRLLTNSVSSDLTNAQQPTVIEKQEGLLERWIEAMMEENMCCVSANSDSRILTAEQKALLFFTKAITLLALSCVVFNNSSVSQDPRVAAVMQSSNSNIWLIMVEQLLGELIVQVLVKSMVTWLVHASFRESAILKKLYLQSEERAWSQKRFLLSLNISNRSELYDLRAMRELKTLLPQLEALKHITKAQLKLHAQDTKGTRDNATLSLEDQLVAITRKLSEVKTLLKRIQAERENKVLSELRNEIEGKGLYDHLIAYWRLHLRKREEVYETNLYVLTRAMTPEQRLQRSFDMQVSSVLRNQPIKLFLYNTCVKTKSFHVSTFSSRWFSVLTLITVTAFNSIMSIGVLLWGLTTTNLAIELALICLAVSAILDVFTISPMILFVKCYLSWSAERLLRVPMTLASRRHVTKDERLRRSARGIVEEEIEMMQSLLHLPSQHLKPVREDITADSTPDTHPHRGLYV